MAESIELDTSVMAPLPNGRKSEMGMSEEDLLMAQKLLGDVEAVNLDEVTQEIIAVTVMEESEEEIEHGGKTYKRKKFTPRRVEILNYVPVDILNEMLLGRVNLIKKCKNSGMDADQIGAEVQRWSIEPVWKVWRLTEPWVETPAQLGRMIDGVKVQVLFVRFFGSQLRSIRRSV